MMTLSRLAAVSLLLTSFFWAEDKRNVTMAWALVCYFLFQGSVLFDRTVSKWFVVAVLGLLLMVGYYELATQPAYGLIPC